MENSIEVPAKMYSTRMVVVVGSSYVGRSVLDPNPDPDLDPHGLAPCCCCNLIDQVDRVHQSCGIVGHSAVVRDGDRWCWW